MGGDGRRGAGHAPVGSPSIRSSSPTVGAIAPRAVVLRSPTTGITVVRYMRWQAHGRRCAPVLRAAALRQLRRAAPVSPL